MSLARRIAGKMYLTLLAILVVPGLLWPLITVISIAHDRTVVGQDIACLEDKLKGKLKYYYKDPISQLPIPNPISAYIRQDLEGAGSLCNFRMEWYFTYKKAPTTNGLTREVTKEVAKLDFERGILLEQLKAITKLTPEEARQLASIKNKIDLSRPYVDLPDTEIAEADNLELYGRYDRAWISSSIHDYREWYFARLILSTLPIIASVLLIGFRKWLVWLIK